MNDCEMSFLNDFIYFFSFIFFPKFSLLFDEMVGAVQPSVENMVCNSSN